MLFMEICTPLESRMPKICERFRINTGILLRLQSSSLITMISHSSHLWALALLCKNSLLDMRRGFLSSSSHRISLSLCIFPTVISFPQTGHFILFFSLQTKSGFISHAGPLLRKIPSVAVYVFCPSPFFLLKRSLSTRPVLCFRER